MNTRTVVTAMAVVGSLLMSAQSWAADKHLTIMLSSPDLAFPFSVHIMKEMQDEAAKLGNIDVVVSDGQRNSSKQSADIEAAITKGVDGIVISPNDSAALAPAIQEAIDAKIPVVTVDRSVDSVKGILAHVGADNVKGGEVQGQLIIKLFPNGANVMNLQGQPGTSAAIDRNKGLHNALDPLATKYKFVFEDTAGFDRAKGLSVTESALASMGTPPDAIAAANDDMALGALEALKGRELTGKVKLIGFDALPESLGKVRDGRMTGTIEQMPGKQGRQAVDILVAFARDGKVPENKITLLTPIAVTNDNLDAGERLGELK
ncbi:substrate-binding domain-containing protein [Mesorhizobium sp.]|uniref:substrate-binding domain-containing protein n=2 Tax=Mesorhizobium sp. TaxID=1871066 RepID=UPI0012095579|nr:substrate-binding domain-containing protein [Mesorhizobium sp.]TIO07076.1 MAG: sugar ABC transporter substrate-binding protein [Mesorhizobium sp.]TIO35968.1 MAG: sugar ABC transporter substrate-binding protein [Mesorhizobium sp.]TIP07721.1 MAG: sugar ABC transporter substrate-binding protein [Mesorhizobium sp.]